MCVRLCVDEEKDSEKCKYVLWCARMLCVCVCVCVCVG
jgi:hypothetical protein